MRCGYSDELDQRELAMWRGRVASSIRGKRGQKLLRELLAALDAMPEKRLIREELVDGDGDVCLLGAAARARGIPNIAAIDPEDHDSLGKLFNVAPCLIQEIEFANDDEWGGSITPEHRFERMRKWLLENIREANAQTAPSESVGGREAGNG